MKAAVCYEYGKPLVIEELDIDPPKQGEVKVRMAATAICHSDIHAIKGDFPAPLPFLPGHESAGYVEAVGEGVTSVKPGDPVVVSLLTSCGQCYECLAGRSWMCENRWPLDDESRLHNSRGQAVRPMTRVGSFAEYVIVNESQLVPLPIDMPLESAALLACGFITGFGAVVNTARARALSSAAIIGVGGVGLSAVQGAALSGAYPIVAVDILESKLKSALSFGATHGVLATEGDAAGAVRALTGNRGAENVFVTVGNSEAIRQGFAMCAPRGTMVMIGLPPLAEPVTLPTAILWNERKVTMSRMGSTPFRRQIPQLVALYQAGRIKLDEMISNRYPLDQINEAIASVETGEVLRNVIVF